MVSRAAMKEACAHAMWPPHFGAAASNAGLSASELRAGRSAPVLRPPVPVASNSSDDFDFHGRASTSMGACAGAAGTGRNSPPWTPYIDALWGLLQACHAQQPPDAPLEEAEEPEMQVSSDGVITYEWQGVIASHRSNCLDRDAMRTDRRISH
mmetsp:Transcript_87713/g.248607  ORF Transcript_87713/g.248607 Transcript_87713/m.248607 type:complete len:153 (+) Transcript_87713:112-570(+)